MLVSLRFGMITGLVALLIPGAWAQSTATDSLEELQARLPADTQKVLVLRELAYEYMQPSPGRVTLLVREMLAISESKGFAKGKALAYDVEGNLLRLRGDYTGAVNRHLDALRIFDSLHDIKRYRSVLVNTGTDYSYLREYKKALDYYYKALELTDKGETRRYVTILNNIASVHSQQQEHTKAIGVLQEALPFADADSTYQMQSTVYSGLSIALAGTGRLEEAVSWMMRANHCQELSGDRFHLAASLSTLGGYHIGLKQYDRVPGLLDRAEAIAQELGARSVIANVYRNRAELYKKTERFRESYHYLEKYTMLNDSLINESHMTQLADAEARFNMEMKDRELALLNADKALKESELRMQTAWKYLLMLFLIAAAALLFFAYRNMQLRKKANISLEARNNLLQKEHILAQYETLRNQVNPHFLFNSLNALNSLIRSDAARAAEFTAVFARLYRNVLELKGDVLIPLSEELGLVRNYVYLQKIRFGGNLVLQEEISPDTRDAMLPPFCLQMLIENAVKHNIISGEQPLRIRIYTEGRFLVVANNFQPRAQKSESTGVGIRNIVERFRLIHDVLPDFHVSGNEYLAKIPLITPV